MAGRPLTTGEKRMKRVTLNLSDSMFNDIQDLSSIYGKAAGLYIMDLISKDIGAQRTKIDAFRALRDNE